jgi:ABC-type transport system involved in multi-copper enzyme maturation permease subunit
MCSSQKFRGGAEMFFPIAWFEIKYWLRSWMLWIFLLVIATMIFGAVSTDQIQVGVPLTNTFRNAPYVIENFYSLIGLLTLLMATAFLNSAAARDFSHNTYQIVFSTPMRRFDFIFGRFLGATLISVLPMVGVSLGILVAKYMPWVDPERWGPVNWTAHLYGILVFAVPNAFFVAAVLFAIAVLARNEIISFVGALGLLTGYIVADSLLQDIEREHVAALLDPFGIRTFALATKYWTVFEKNTNSIGLTGLLLWNRLIWIGVGCVILLFAYWRFSFAERSKKIKKRKEESPDAPVATVPLVVKAHLEQAPWRKFVGSLRVHFLGLVKSTFFIVIVIAALANTIPTLVFNSSEGYGLSILPVTYRILELIAGSLYLFLYVMVTYFAGVLVWKDRDARMDEIADSLPTPEWVSYAARLVTLLGALGLILVITAAGGIVVQAAHGYHRYQLGLYASQLFWRDGSLLLLMAILAFFIHVLSPNKYVGYFLYVTFIILDLTIWRPLNISTHLLQFAGRPSVVYSDFFGDAPYRTAWNWFTLYWLLFCGLLYVATVMLWPRGRQASWEHRWQNAVLRFTGAWKFLTAVFALLFIASGAWIYYNTKILNKLAGPKDEQRVQANYEKTYKPLAKQRQPRVRSIKYAIDIFPETRNMTMDVEEVIQNPYQEPLNEIHFSVARGYDTNIEIPGAELSKDDKRLLYRIYRFTSPLQPGESRTAHFIVKSKTRGFENSVSIPELVQNGTFFNNEVAPIIGYNSERELTDPNDRRDNKLPEQELMLPLERNCTADCMDTYLPGHSDLVDVESVVSTSPDQIAIAPGSLLREWQANGRRYFQYKLDHPSMNYYSFISGRYQVAREEWNGVKVEVYYLPEHAWNVPRMVSAVKKSLDYYTHNFSPYVHKEARIIEFPRVAQFAQAFPGTMPYSESIGFIADISKPDDIDMVYYVVAHEMGHQWWAYQVVGANMQGATLLSESMAQYSALMVMEKEYGRDIMRKFLRYEMDRYLAGRGRERLKERPLLTVEAEQGYVHYRKASVVMYYLKEMIGEEAVNRALRKLIARYGYADPPYPTSWALLDDLRSEMTPEQQYLIKDLFEDITFFSNRALQASASQRADGKYDVTIEVEAQKFKADPKGNETEVVVDDWIDIGAFAKPEKDKKYGKTLYRQREHITQPKSSFTFTTDELPDQAGIDPFLLLIDRVPDDNTKKVELKEAATTASK